MVFRFLEHTADILFEAEGKDLKEALEEAAHAIVHATATNVKKKEKFEIKETAPNIEEAVVGVLQKLLAEAEIKSLLPADLDVKEVMEKADKITIKAIGWAGEGEQKTIVKGVTYGMLKVERNKTCKIRVLLDV